MILILLLVGVGGIMLAASASPGQATGNDQVNERVIGSVGEQVITETRYLESVEAVETNLDYMHEEIENGSLNQELLERFVQMIERHGVHNVALASLIQELALYEFALDQGVTVPTREVNARVERDRNLLETVDPPPDFQARVDAVGPERFWSEVYPPIIERELTINRLWQAVTTGIPDQAEQARVWTAVQQHVVSETTISWPDTTDSDLIRADPESALAYLNEYWTLN